MTPEEEAKENRRLKEDKKIYPPFLVEEFKKGREEIRIEEKTGKYIPYNPTKITDFLNLIHSLWKISNKDYQECFWVRREAPVRGDCFDNTTETFEERAEAALDQKDPFIEMTDKQRKMLTHLLHLVEEYEDDPTTPLSRYGENDAPIVADPRWDKIRQYAKMVYQEITGESADLITDMKEIKS